MRGEYIRLRAQGGLMKGSPPHAWRILGITPGRVSQLGITSTCVENTLKHCKLKPVNEDHLHMRGEYSKQIPL